MASKTQIGFGNKSNLSKAIEDGKLDEYDLLCLNDTDEMGWIDKNKVTHTATSRTKEDIKVMGVSGLGKADQQVIPAGSSLDEIIKMLVQKQVHPTYKAPTMGFAKTVDASKTDYEAGSTVSVALRTTYTQNDGGAITQLNVLKNGTSVHTADSAPADYTESLVLGDETVSYTATIAYADGAVKKDNFGENDSYGQIKAGTLKSPTTLRYVGKRNRFYAAKTGSQTEFTSDELRALAGKTFNTGFTINVPVGAQTIVFAIPSTQADPKVRYEEANDNNAITKFTKTTVQVADARGGENGMIAYKLFVYAMATPAAAAMTFIIK